MTPNPKRSGNRRSRGAKNRLGVLELHVQGYTFKQIGEQLGFSKQRAHQLYREELEENHKARAELAHVAREHDLATIDHVIKCMTTKMQKGDSKAATVVLRALTRRAALLGLDAPRKTELTGPNGTPLTHPEERTPAALHDRLASLAAHAVGGADTGATGEAEPDGA